MNIIYNKEETINRMAEQSARLSVLKRIRNTVYCLNLATTLICIYNPINCLLTSQPFTTTDFVSNIILLVCVIASTILAKKSVPDVLSLPADVWYHVATSEFSLLETKTEKTEKGRSVSLCFENEEHKKFEICLGEFETQVNRNVEEETLDLETGVVFIPAV